jgi:hypothetical protein
MTTQSKMHDNIRLGTTLFSYTTEFYQRKFSFEQLIEEVARRGQGPGLEVVGFQSFRDFPEVSDETASRFKDIVARSGLELSCLGLNADTQLRPDYIRSFEERLDLHAKQIRSAAKLGFPVVRYQYAAGPDVIKALAPLAQDLNVKLGLEIHAPHTVHHPDVMAFREMYAQVNSPYLGFIPDFGASARAIPPSYLKYYRSSGVPENAIEAALELWAEESDPWEKRPRFLAWAEKAGIDKSKALEVNIFFGLFSRQPHRNWLEIMPQVVHVHGKFYDVDESGEDKAIDYAGLINVFAEGGYRGYITSEWEGHQVCDDSAFPYVERHHEMLKKLIAGSILT